MNVRNSLPDSVSFESLLAFKRFGTNVDFAKFIVFLILHRFEGSC